MACLRILQALAKMQMRVSGDLLGALARVKLSLLHYTNCSQLFV